MSDEYGLVEVGTDDLGAPRRRPLLLGSSAVGLVILLLIAGFGLGRPEPIPAPTAAEPTISPTPDGDVLDWTGIGSVRVGMPLTELLLSLTDRSRLIEMSRDEERGCVQYQASTASDYTPWVWVRDGTVVTVGVQFGGGVPTVVGPEIGGPFNPDDPTLSGWDRDEAAPLPVLRSHRGDLIATLADDRATGTLSYASVGTLAGDECVPAALPDPFWHTEDPDASVIEGDSVAGVSLGMTAEQVAATPGWAGEAGRSDETCVLFADAHGAGAEIVPGDGVVALSAGRIAGGPAAGQSLADASDLVAVQRTTRHESGLTVVDATSTDGHPVRLLAATPEIAVAGLDLPVVPSRGSAAEERVFIVVLGNSCLERG